MSEQGLKTEQPTAKRLREAHDEGNFARSPDINMVFVLVAAFMTLLFTSQEQTKRIAGIAVGIFGQLGKYAIKPEGIHEWAGIAVGTMLELVLPMAVACAIAGALAGALQTRFRLTPKVLGFKPERLNPVQGFKRIFSAQGWVKLGTDALKLVVVAALLYGAVGKVMSDPIFYTPVGVARLGGFIEEAVTSLLGRFILALGGIAAINYLYQRHKVGQDLMMTKQEVKEEHKSSEGDPTVRAAQRHMARRLLQKQMLKSVPTADVVITNPTHFAVALKYERGRDKAPVVLAKGERLFAQRIKAIAREHEVPTIENKPVARMLFKYGKVGKTIPMELYQAVAEILAYVYKTHRYYFHRLKDRRAGM